MTRVSRLIALAASVALCVGVGSAEEDLLSKYQHTPTSCDQADCKTGGCLFENCVKPVTCGGGLCLFRRCKEASCDGGSCTFDNTESPTCLGGACRFKNMQTTLKEGYCDGGACTLDGSAHPAKLSDVLSA
ncbi:hypothetical protein PINS_up003322 [Pythium insidiosum]|nr:hypothetical protein PINS_up003322 [Pythium insidiosum]